MVDDGWSTCPTPPPAATACSNVPHLVDKNNGAPPPPAVAIHDHVFTPIDDVDVPDDVLTMSPKQLKFINLPYNFIHPVDQFVTASISKPTQTTKPTINADINQADHQDKEDNNVITSHLSTQWTEFMGSMIHQFPLLRIF